MAKKKLSGAQKRKLKRERERADKELHSKDQHAHQESNVEGSQADTPQTGDGIFTNPKEVDKDIRLLDLAIKQGWKIPDRAYRVIPEDLMKTFEDKETDFERKKKIADTFAKFNGQNAAQEKTVANYNLHLHRYQGRHTHAEDPEADEIAETAQDQPQIAFREKVVEDEMVDMLQELDDLGLMSHFTGQS